MTSSSRDRAGVEEAWPDSTMQRELAPWGTVKMPLPWLGRQNPWPLGGLTEMQPIKMKATKLLSKRLTHTLSLPPGKIQGRL